MNPRAEAFERIGGRHEARVLEPSPPAVSERPWFADDPVARGEVPPGRLVVSPAPNGDLRWEELAADDRKLAEWCADRWLGPWRRLGDVPAELVQTRLALHALAERVVSPARQQANGKIGLRFTRGGFGTPFFGSDVQIRVERDQLIVAQRGGEHASRVTTLAAAAEQVGPELLPAELPAGGQRLELDTTERLEVDAGAATFLGDWYGFGASVLEELRVGADAELTDPSRVQLWPEHFDIAVELGREQAAARAGYGCSPGDEDHPEPYLYVAPWVAPQPGELWHATAFKGAELPYGALRDAPDQRRLALDFFGERLAALSPGASPAPPPAA